MAKRRAVKKRFITVPVSALVAAEWNYKVAGSDERVKKLIESIKKDKSAGVPVVREFGDGQYEVIDGNHRLIALQQLGWKRVMVENFGPISQAEAVIVAKRRNALWFDDDPLAFALLLRDVVFKETGPDELEKFMIETKDELQAIAELPDFDWDWYNRPEDTKRRHVPTKLLHIQMDGQTFDLWVRWQRKGTPGATDAELLLSLLKAALSKAQNGTKKGKAQDTA